MGKYDKVEYLQEYSVTIQKTTINIFIAKRTSGLS
jgi:hypothetical protein